MPSSMNLSEHLLSDLQFLLSRLYHMPKSTAVWGWVWLYPFSKPSGFFLGSYIFLKTSASFPNDSILLLWSSEWLEGCPWLNCSTAWSWWDCALQSLLLALEWDFIQGSPKVCSGLAFTCVLCPPPFHCLQLSDFSPSPATVFSSALLLAYGSPGLLPLFKLPDQRLPFLPQGLCTCYC